MFQEILALVVIFFFLFRLGWQLWHGQIPRGQFLFWLVFWLLSGILIIFIKQVDALVARLGFSSSGIEILLYIAVVVMFYFIFRLRLKLQKIENEITKLVQAAAISGARKPKD